MKNLLNGSVDYKLGDVAAEEDVGTYAQLMKLLTGSDKDGAVIQNFKDFEKGKGTALAAKDGVNDALEGLNNIHVNETALAAKNADIKAKQDRVRVILSKIGSTGYSMPVTKAELQEAANLLGIDVARLIAADERGDALNLNELLKESSKLTLGNVTTTQQQEEFRKILATLAMGDKNFDATAAGPLSSVDIAAEQFYDEEPYKQKLDYEVGQVALDTTGENIYEAEAGKAPLTKEEEEAMIAYLESLSKQPGSTAVTT